MSSSHQVIFTRREDSGSKVIKKSTTWDFLPGYVLKRGDLIVAMTEQAEGLLGSPALIPKNDLYLHNQRLGLIIVLNTKRIDKRFLYYLFNFRSVREQISSTANGAKIRHTSPSRIYEVKVDLPPLSSQQKIAAILSSYDRLIENNQRRIAIFGEMARLIYDEWFVKFGFPGHDKVKMVESELGVIPHAWQVTQLGECITALETGKRPKGGATEAEGGIPSIGAENIDGIGVHDYAAEKYVPRDYYNNMRKGIVRDRDVALYKDGAYIGKSSYFRNGFPYSECCVNEHVFLIRADGKRLTQNALYLWLRLPDAIHAIRSTNANAAQPGVNQDGIKGLKVLLPTQELAQQFDHFIEPFLAEIVNLAKRNRNLRMTRELLLPKLISGEIDVEELDIKMPAENGVAIAATV